MKKFLLLMILSSSVPLYSQAAFPDVPDSHPHAEAINYLQQNKVVAGNPDGTYRPEESISRAAFTKIIVETYFGQTMAQQCDVSSLQFPDVDKNAWYASYICLAYKKNLIKGYDDGTFRPGNTINVAEAAKIISAHRKGVRTGNPWFKPYLEDLGEIGALPTEIKTIGQMVNRGIMAEIIYRIKANKRTKPHLLYAQILSGNKMMDKETSMMKKDDEKMMDKETSMMKKDDEKMMDKETSMMKKAARNVAFTPALFDQLLSSGDKFVLNFHANWCPNCRQLENDITKNLNQLPDGTTILKVDYDNSANLKKKYGVTLQTTGVFFEQGKKVKTKPNLNLNDIKAFF